MAALFQSLQKISWFWMYCQNPWKATVKELIHLSSNVFCIFNLKFFTVNTLRGVSDSFVKQETPVPTSTIPANPDSHLSLLTNPPKMFVVPQGSYHTIKPFCVKLFRKLWQNFYWRICLEEKHSDKKRKDGKFS